MNFQLHSKFKPTGDQPKAIDQLLTGLKSGRRDQVLLGVTGSGKTFTMANVIAKINRPTLVISHNKTLAAQLASEFREFFPKNAVHYFVSFYDYYQPEAYIARTDTYIEKDSAINDEIDRLRHASTSALLSRRDVIIVASVSCIYGIGSPELYQANKLDFKIDQEYNFSDLAKQLTQMQYQRNDFELLRGRFRIRGDIIEVFPAYEEDTIRLEFFGSKLEKISKINTLTGEIKDRFAQINLFPATHYLTDQKAWQKIEQDIRHDLSQQIAFFRANQKPLEAERINQRTNFDLEMIQETGTCSGIENYSRYLDQRSAGQPPSVLLDYFPKDYLTIIDESHMTVPQIGAMHAGDRARKDQLIDYGFRLPSARDNRPLTFTEFEKKSHQTIYTSATPGPYELTKASGQAIKTIYELKHDQDGYVQKTAGIAEQIIRPTGLLDPKIEVKPSKHQIDSLIAEINLRIERHERVLVTTLTKTMAEDLADHLQELNIKTAYIHFEVDTLERIQIINDLRRGKYDVLVGINLLREGLDLPEVSLVAILDADKEGFLRSSWSLIQVMGRAARHINGRVIMYADKITGSMKQAIDETNRRRAIQELYNQKHHLTPQGIQKAIRAELEPQQQSQTEIDLTKVPKSEIKHLITDLEAKMELAAKSLEFEQAALIRDEIIKIKKAHFKGKIKLKEIIY